jgi:flagellar FliL protein
MNVSGEAVAEDLEGAPPEAAEAVPVKKLTGKKIVLFIGLPVLLLGGAVAGVTMSGILGGQEQSEAGAAKEPAQPAKAVFYDLPEMLVNLNSVGRRPSFLKIKVSLEIANEADVPHLEALKPRIVDNFQVHLRELRTEDLRGSAGIYRLREELLARVGAAVHPVKVKNVLFNEVLVQ